MITTQREYFSETFQAVNATGIRFEAVVFENCCFEGSDFSRTQFYKCK